MPPIVTIRPAAAADLPAIHKVIERAYRGETARAGWTHEADLIEGDRTSIAALSQIVANPAEVLLLALDGGVPIGCVHLADRGNGTTYLGLLCVDPSLQATGLGKRILDAAEIHARDHFGAARIEMTVIDVRRKLIEFYQRRGYVATGETRDFPIALDPPLFMTVLAKPLT